MSPSELAKTLQQASLALQNSQWDSCHRLLDQVAPVDRTENWLSIKSAALALSNRLDEAASLLHEGLAVYPDSLSLRINLGMVQRDGGELDSAIATFAYATVSHPQAVEGWLNLGYAQMAARRWDAAADSLYAAAKCAPNRADIRLAAALSLARGEHHEPARAALESTRDPDSGQLPNDPLVARIYMALNDSAPAREALRRFLQAHPSHVEGWAYLALLEERANRITEATAAIAKIPASHHAMPVAALARTRLLQREKQFEQALNSLSTEQLDDPDLAVEIMFERARLLDALGRYEEAHAAASVANSGAKQLRGGKPGVLNRLLAQGVPRGQVQSWPSLAGDADSHPVFLLGLPRSGSTLLDLMLDGHEKLQVLSETDALEQLVEQSETLTGQAYPACLAALTTEQIRSLQLQYFDRAEQHLSRQAGGRLAGTRLVDKNPLNLLRLPLIHRLFPGAPLVITERDLHDAALSCFLNDLGGRGEQGFWSLDESLEILSSLTTFIQDQCQALNLNPHRMVYEDWIQQPEKALKALCKKLGISFDPRMLNTAQTAQSRGPIDTPSYAAVTEKPSSNRIGRWRHYAKFFPNAT